MVRGLWGVVLLSVSLIALSGCGQGGPALGQVTGTITQDGRPLPDAFVSFYPAAGGRSSHGMTDQSGKYLLRFTGMKDGALVGAHTVKIETGVQLSESETGPKPKKVPQLPARYNAESELTAEVERGNNTFDFDVQAK
ncbi:carboxypeptidase regulatory-like domain-containing protein [Blastopirellula sp. JC732]|uniref:Carboxypeptidase regulatory-like domain-containing protein n=1 Tax=Blastopirellula sediminis TaxID=2894196 RepID=A0A9X1MKL7_9BACT|nr:carboxypeptidase regulatory-like domain-containing protein [Blastopirellula sediminis]MCC9609263.1 carboxypeptidase regulatory-like domain-containing protein [Blastopirellula sediminis]MCC9627960.1 carboxypeptidase regulatory-like domain-containing protein [Blastopirellula sediminis]